VLEVLTFLLDVLTPFSYLLMHPVAQFTCVLIMS